MSQQIYCFGGWNHDDDFLSSVSHLPDCSTGEWSSCPPLSGPRDSFTGAVIGSKIYLAGGWTGEDKLDSMEVFDTQSNCYTKLASMPGERMKIAGAALGDAVYISGAWGSSDQEGKSMLRYDIQDDSWRAVAPMATDRYDHQLIELNGQLYAIGGYDSDTVERYDGITDQWSAAPNTTNKHRYAGACALNRAIYVCSELGFEFYTPETDSWASLEPPNQFVGRCLVSLGDKLWSLGGGNDYEGATAHISEYDPRNGRWTQRPDMDIPRKFYCSFVVQN